MYGRGINSLEQQLWGGPLDQALFGPRRLPAPAPLPIMPRLGRRGRNTGNEPIKKTRLRYLKRRGYLRPSPFRGYATSYPTGTRFGFGRLLGHLDRVNNFERGWDHMSETDRKTFLDRVTPRLRGYGLL